MAKNQIMSIRKHAHAHLKALGGRGSDVLAGVSFVDDGAKCDPPKRSVVNTGFVLGGIREGWITGDGSNTVIRPGGPPENPDDPERAHVFQHFTTLTFHTVDGDHFPKLEKK